MRHEKHGITALTYFWSGINAAAHSAPELRPDYLRRTVASLRPLAGTVFVGIQPGERSLPDTEAVRIRLNCQPVLLATELMRWAQQKVTSDYVYVTDGDQVLHCDTAILQYIQGRNYLVPHRLEELGANGSGASRGTVVEYRDKRYVLANRNPVSHPSGFYHPGNQIEGYAGAYFCTRELFGNVLFQKEADPPFVPLEQAAGIDIYHTGRALKTSDWRECFVEHLSGREANEKDDDLLNANPFVKRMREAS